MASIQNCIANSEPGWELYRSFLAVMRTGSLSAAARHLSITQPTVGRHIAALEEALGATLFVRSQDGLKPNPIALSLVPHAENMEMSASALLRAASGSAEEVAGTVRLSASHIVGAELLPDILTEFHQTHPRIGIELLLNNAPSDLLRGEADVAIRMFRPIQDALIAKRIGTVRIGLFARRSYIAQHGQPNGLDDLRGHTLIGFDRDPIWTRATSALNIDIARERFALRCDSELAQLAALRAGFGIGACHAGIARRDPELVPVLPEHFAFRLDVWMTMHRDSRGVRRVAVLFDYLAERLARHCDDDRA